MFQNLKIKTRIMIFVAFIVILISLSIGIIAYMQSSNALMAQLEYAIVEFAEQGSEQVVSSIDIQKIVLEAIANRNVIRTMDWENQQKPALINEVNRTDFIGMGIVDMNGKAKYPDGTEAELGDRDYIKKAMTGITAMSSVLISRVTNSAVIMVATPIKDTSGRIISVLIGRLPGDILTDVTDTLKYGENGYSYIIDGKGTLISHNNRDLIMNQVNYIEESKTKKEFETLAVVMRNMIKGIKGFEGYYYQGENRYMGYSPIEGTDWSI
ncbi:MAG: cache domain-containing protein, partial [Candidatus Cloacimonetes bacterium]|nr:cache domain-containing protein [Candidatus Cloacimonadota bacterium]